MRIARVGLAVAALLAACIHGAGAQMVVNPNVGERVDYPFYSDDGQRLRFRHHHRRVSDRSHPRFVIVQSAFPTPALFGWANCCN